jgi:hypothetical protein
LNIRTAIAIASASLPEILESAAAVLIKSAATSANIGVPLACDFTV